MKCIRDKQGCFWGHVSILGQVKKGYKEEVKGKAGLDDEDEDDDNDDEEEEVRAPRVPQRRSMRLLVAGKLVQCVRYFLFNLCASCRSVEACSKGAAAYAFGFVVGGR